jgi:hypothetical protein
MQFSTLSNATVFNPDHRVPRMLIGHCVQPKPYTVRLYVLRSKVLRMYSGLRNRCPDAQHIPCSRPHTAAAAHYLLSSERTSLALR